MPKPIIASSTSSGKAHKILHLPDALERLPDAHLIFYNRVSSRSNAGKDNVDLDEKTYKALDLVRRSAPGRVRMVVSGVEEGKLSKPKPALIRAVESAKRWRARLHKPMILVAPCLSRWIRSEAFHNVKNPEAPLTDADLAGLYEITDRFPLATWLPPDATASEMHSFLTSLTDKAGRPRKMTPDLERQVFECLGYSLLDDFSRTHYGQSLRSVAADFDIAPATILAAMDRPSVLSGQTWRDWLWTNAERQGLISISPDGVIVTNFVWPLPKRSPRFDRPGRPPKWDTRCGS